MSLILLCHFFSSTCKLKLMWLPMHAWNIMHYSLGRTKWCYNNKTKGPFLVLVDELFYISIMHFVVYMYYASKKILALFNLLTMSSGLTSSSVGIYLNKICTKKVQWKNCKPISTYTFRPLCLKVFVFDCLCFNSYWKAEKSP